VVPSVICSRALMVPESDETQNEVEAALESHPRRRLQVGDGGRFRRVRSTQLTSKANVANRITPAQSCIVIGMVP
jgi:hypothetical protein